MAIGANMENHRHRIKFLVLVVCFILLGYLGRFLHIDIEALERSLGRFPAVYSWIIYIVLYVLVTFFIFFSKDIFWIAGAITFGPYSSALLVYICEIINAFILFHLARYLGRNFVEHYAKKKSQSLDDKLANINFFWLFIIRLVPLIPYRFLDLGVGLTRIRFRRYLIAVLLATPLRALWVQYILAIVGRNIFNKPQLLVGYFLQNRVLFILSIAYLLLIIPVAFKLRRKV